MKEMKYQNRLLFIPWSPVIPKPKTKSGNMLSGIDILQWKFILRRKNKKWGSPKNRD